MNEKPFFSVIIVSFNAEKLIKATIDSVLKQTFEDYEIIVKDGLSKDNTVANIPLNDRIKVYSQADSGIYDAMNQATRLASGRYVIYMNCGDLFAFDYVLEEVYGFLKDKNVSMAYGNYVRDDILHISPQNLTDFYLYRTPLCHQTIFFNRLDLLNIGCYSERYKILGDYEAELKLFFANKDIIFLDIVVCRYLGGGVSESKEGIKKKKQERKEIINRYYPAKLRKKYAFKLAISLPWLRKWLASDNSNLFLRTLYQKLVNSVNR